jgi:hypothetical protein
VTGVGAGSSVTTPLLLPCLPDVALAKVSTSPPVMVKADAEDAKTPAQANTTDRCTKKLMIPPVLNDSSTAAWQRLRGETSHYPVVSALPSEIKLIRRCVGLVAG